MNQIKHGGCHDCGSKTQSVLISVPNGISSKALCDDCLLKSKGGK